MMKRLLPLILALLFTATFVLAAPSISGGGGGGGISGSGTSGQVAYFSGSTTLTGNANLTFNGTTLTSNVGSGSDAIALSTNGARLHLGTGSADYLYSTGASVAVASALIINDQLNERVDSPSSGYWLNIGSTGQVNLLMTAGSPAALDLYYTTTTLHSSSIASDGHYTSSASAGNAAFLASNGGSFYSNATGAPWNAVSVVNDGASAIAFQFDTANALSTSGANLLVLNNNSVPKFTVDYSGAGTFVGGLTWALSVDHVDVGTAANAASAQALPSCSAADSALQYNTSTHAFQCNTGGNIVTFANYCVGAYAGDGNCLGGYVSRFGTEHTLNSYSAICSVGTAGSGGSNTAEEIDLYDLTASSTLTSDSSHFLCQTAAGTPITLTFGAQALTSTHQYVIRQHSKGSCSTGPVDFFCNVNLSP